MQQDEVPKFHRRSPVESRSVKSRAMSDKRRGDLPVPLNLREFLSQEQILSVRQMEAFGWYLAYIRRDTSRDMEIVVSNAAKTTFGVLESDGSINTERAVDVRH